MRLDLWTESEHQILKDFWGKVKIQKIEELLPNRARTSIYAKAEKLGLKANASISHRQFPLNEQYFSIPTTENCYIAGWLASDGSITKTSDNKIRIEMALQLKDIDCLENIKRLTAWAGEIRFVKEIFRPESSVKWSGPQCRFQICCKQWALDLEKYFNIKQNKSLTLIPPNIENIELKLAYILGFFEGDGGFSIRSLNNKDVAQIYCCGTYEMLNWIKDIFDCLFKPNKNWYSQVSERKIMISKNHAQYSVVGERAKSILRRLYELPTPKLKRKWTPELIEFIYK